jgi:hypothetical protein
MDVESRNFACRGGERNMRRKGVEDVKMKRRRKEKC